MKGGMRLMELQATRLRGELRYFRAGTSGQVLAAVDAEGATALAQRPGAEEISPEEYRRARVAQLRKHGPTKADRRKWGLS